MKSPFPWFGGKSRVASLVWERFGNVQNYVEPFFGSGAVLLNRPHLPSTETVNDLDCLVANFWRSLRHEPDLVAEHADNPVNEADQHARHLWLCSQEEFRERMKTEPEFYDPKIAGWWVWGQCIWIGSGWCSRQIPHLGDDGTGIHRQIPHLGDAGAGIHRKRPHLGDAGAGIHRKRPSLGNAGRGIHRQSLRLVDDGTGGLGSDLALGPRRSQLLEYMRELSERLRSVRVCCGDWSRVCGPSVTVKHGITGVFLDPPYADEAKRTNDLYAQDSGQVAHAVREWAVEWGADRRARIALCGYEGEHAMPNDWECVQWKANGGYGSQGETAARENSTRERIWFSPYCLRASLFSDLEG